MDKPTSPASPMSLATTLSSEEETVVAAFNTPIEAEMARGRLEVDGIPARILDGNTVGVAQHLSMALGGVKLAVSLGDLEAARTILFSPSALIDGPEGLADEDEPATLAPPITANDVARSALRSSVLGLVVLPPVGHLWSVWLLVTRVWPERHTLDDQGRRRATIAAVVDAAVAAAAAALIAA